ncbi:MAG TPA: class I SAM-dependent methyltransferase, partial [Casimicrobiaceae bacterium]|nr:class I SAM-dependent methyltransferase [Casimicrobiaceae bacterium]
MLPPSGVAISYVLCDQCRFCFAPEFATWSLEHFETKVYNAEYVAVDPDYLDTRPRANANSLLATFGDRGKELRHLDYGGGRGLLSDLLRERGWRSESYDPCVDRSVSLQDLGPFDLVTAYEVFEHVPDVRRLVADLASLLNPDGVVLFSCFPMETYLPGTRCPGGMPRRGTVTSACSRRGASRPWGRSKDFRSAAFHKTCTHSGKTYRRGPRTFSDVRNRCIEQSRSGSAGVRKRAVLGLTSTADMLCRVVQCGKLDDGHNIRAHGCRRCIPFRQLVR